MNFNRFKEGRDLRKVLSPSTEEIMKEMDMETKKDMVFSFISDFHTEHDKLPSVDEVTEHYEHIYIDDIIVLDELRRF